MFTFLISFFFYFHVGMNFGTTVAMVFFFFYKNRKNATVTFRAHEIKHNLHKYSFSMTAIIKLMKKLCYVERSTFIKTKNERKTQ